MRWTRDKREQIPLRAAQFSYVVLYCTFNEPWTDSRDPYYISDIQGCRSFCRGGFNKPCTWNDPFSTIPFYIFLFNLFVESTKCESRQRNNLIDFSSSSRKPLLDTLWCINVHNIRFKYTFSFSVYPLEFCNFIILRYRFTSMAAEKSFQEFHLKYDRNSRVIAPTRKKVKSFQIFFPSWSYLIFVVQIQREKIIQRSRKEQVVVESEEKQIFPSGFLLARSKVRYKTVMVIREEANSCNYKGRINSATSWKTVRY